MKIRLWQVLTLVGALFGLANSVAAATLTYDFNLPATGNPSIGPPYPTVATLTITDVAGGVQMTLTPNWSSPGWQSSGSVKGFDIVFPTLSGSFTLTNNTGAQIKSWDVSSNPNMDSSYTSNASVFSVQFDTSNNKEFENVSGRDISSWILIGTDLTTASFLGLFATANNKPSPIFGVISIQSYALDGLTPTPSNWVAGTSAVPIPAAAWLFGSALLGLAGLGYRRRSIPGSSN